MHLKKEILVEKRDKFYKKNDFNIYFFYSPYTVN
jgi:hypothetical protein